MRNIIAVYGSLKKGAYNHPWLRGAEFIGKAEITGAMYLVAQSYPGLILTEDFTGTVDKVNTHDVELYKVDKDTYEDIYSMEIGAGYKALERPFRISQDPETFVTATIYVTEEYPGEREWIRAYSKDTVPQSYS